MSIKGIGSSHHCVALLASLRCKHVHDISVVDRQLPVISQILEISDRCVELPGYSLPVLLKLFVCIEPARRQLLLDLCYRILLLTPLESELTGQGPLLVTTAAADLGSIDVFFSACVPCAWG